ncbi:hypothetical protein [Aequorivita sp. Q41]|uniref:hypothetical protein n=1 Tax=Aequorivita sp. Q41 TaxID=3153300 RepID=UPI0032428F97
MTLYVIVFIIALIRLPLYKDTPLKYLPIILFITLATEFVGQLLKIGHRDFIFLIYNIYYFLYFSFFFYVFMKVIDVVSFKKCIKIGLAIFWLVFLGDIVFSSILKESFIITYIVGAGILILCIILYYISILQSSLVLVVKNDLLFWISVGLFLFYIGYIPIKIIKTWFYKPDSFFEILLIIQFSLIILMYLFFLTGFLWMKKR